MKTVMDAVNEFRGEFNLEAQDSDTKMILEVTKVSGDDFLGQFKYGYEGYNKNYRAMVCDESQFNDLVSQLETNFGESYESELKTWQQGIKRQPETDKQFKDKLNEMDKELEEMEIKIDWSKAPEGATHVMISEVSNTWYKVTEKTYADWLCGKNWLLSGWKRDDVINEASFGGVKFKTKPKSQQPVFKAGQEVFIAQINTLAGIDAKRYFVMEYWCGSGHQKEYAELGLLFSAKEDAESKCRELVGLPKLDTRTDKEKAIDYMKYAYEKGNNMEDVLSEITKGYVAGVKWVGE